ncbi:hypothetical protein F503_05882 [Ophiostoma piceae UAMH 11346]|uniref:Uncharacterized protein n=1 Tax=Ophiostoma piceae (strain UAMH 11346) TaxID=1262450 RepID=S3CCZ7_OPHP1|nr:hypothetical protein F503_05882 [Ophiostoma piceae UAMH 11346]
MLIFQLGEILHVRQISSGNTGDPNHSDSTTTQDQGNSSKPSGGSSKNYTAAIVVAIVAVVFTVGIFGWIGFRRWQRTRAPKYSRSGRDDNDHPEAGPATAEARPAGTTNPSTTATVDRNTSVRSVMTLPPYRPRALEGESVLGREGERDGIDVVVEMPTAEADESLREEEMDTLYQIRLARRRHQEERDERREARREARARGDQIALETIRQQSRSATSNNPHELERLRTEHTRAQEQRQRAVSSVSYADLGVARHDGTRIRANSNESERMGLLSDAASIGASGRSPSALSQNFPRPDAHQRGRSASSVLSINTTHSDDLGQQLQEPTQGSRSRASSTGRAGSSPELIDPAEADMGEGGLPPHSPPGYDEVSLNDLTPQQSRSESPYPEPPPDYSAASGPTETRNRRLSAHVADLAAEASTADATPSTVPDVAGGGASRSSNDSQGSRPTSRVIPQLPSLRLAQLPQIVIEPSSAVPRDNDP